jgi:hypothetical protein
MLHTPVAVAMTTEQTVAMITPNNIAASIWLNQSKASGIQQTLRKEAEPGDQRIIECHGIRNSNYVLPGKFL